MKAIGYCLAALFVVLSSGARAAELANDEQKTLYALGIAISQSLNDFALTAKELEIVKAGLTDGVMKREPKVDMNDYGPRIEKMVQARATAVADGQKKAGAEFVARAAAEKGARTTASGAVVKTLKEGNGPAPKATDTVTVHYHGTLIDGTVFDSSVKRGQPATFPLANVVKCWTEGVQMIKVGGKSRLVCPAALAYGDRGSPPRIPPGATLVFEVELIGIADR